MRQSPYLLLPLGALLLAACGQITEPTAPAPQAVPERCSDNLQNPFKNCGFETGDFTGWVTQDLAEPYRPLRVVNDGTFEGDFAIENGFDAITPGHIKVCQTVTVPLVQPLLTFDYRANWENSGAKDRVFRVTLTSNDNEIFSQPVVTAKSRTSGNTGVAQGAVDLSDVGGKTGSLCFDWEIPEYKTGPGSAMLDNVNLSGPTFLPPTPETATYTIDAEKVSSKDMLYGVRVGEGMSGPAHEGRVSVSGRRVINGKFREGQAAKVVDVWGGNRIGVVNQNSQALLNLGGGQLQFIFNPYFGKERVTVKELTIYNVIKPGAKVNLYKGRTLVRSIPVPLGKAGEPVKLTIDEPGISLVSVFARFPVAVDDLVVRTA